MTTGFELFSVCRQLSLHLQAQLLIERTHHEIAEALLNQAGPNLRLASEFGRAYLIGESPLMCLVSSLSTLTSEVLDD